MALEVIMFLSFILEQEERSWFLSVKGWKCTNILQLWSFIGVFSTFHIEKPAAFLILEREWTKKEKKK
jgi:hypothetical protein